MCGAVRYEASASPLFTAICHCRQCQRQSGSAFSLVTGFPADGVKMSGTTKAYDDVGETGGRVERHFCPECGSPICSLLEALPGMVFIKSGTLDDPRTAVPSIEAYCDRALDFLPAIAGTTRFARSNLEIGGGTA